MTLNLDPSIESTPDPNRSPERRRSAKPIHWFALQSAIGLLLLGWVSGENSLYPRLFHAQANGLFRWVGTDRWLEFSWVDPNSRLDRSDTQMLGMARGSRPDGSQQWTPPDEAVRRWRAVFSVRRRGYWPLATWVAVMLATPMPSRLRRIAAGAIALDVLLIAQVALIAVCAFGATGPQAAPLWERGSAIATRLFNSPVPTYSLLFALWVWLANPAEGIALSGTAATLRRRVGLDRGHSR